MYLNSIQFLKLWQETHGNLKKNHISQFLNDKRIVQILKYSEVQIKAACTKNKKFDDMLAYLNKLNNFKEPKSSKPKLDKFDFSIKLQKEATIAEKLLWTILQKYDEKIEFKFQYIIYGYIADFYYPKGKMVIELDGKIHKNRVGDDAKRSQILGMNDIAVYRFSNAEVISNPKKVADKIIFLAKKRNIFNSDLNQGFEIVDKANVNNKKGKKIIQVEQSKSKNNHYRCEMCKKSWSGPPSKKKCYKCNSTKNVVRICYICKLRKVPDKISLCQICIDARIIRKSEVGASKQKWRQGKHKVRKIK